MDGMMNFKYFPPLFKGFLCLFCFPVWFPCFAFPCFASGPSGWPFVRYGYAVIFVIQLELYQCVWPLEFPLLACASVEVKWWTAVKIIQDYCVNTQPEDVNSSRSDGNFIQEASSCNTGALWSCLPPGILWLFVFQPRPPKFNLNSYLQ